MNKLIQVLNKAKELHKDKYDYSNIKEYTKMAEKYVIKCKIHGDFIQTLHKHLQGDGCKECSLKNRNKGSLERYEKQFIESSNKVHNNEYDYSNVKYIKATLPVNIKCNIHGIFEVTPNKHLGGQGCKECSKIRVKETLKYPLNSFLEEVKEKYGNKYDYSKIIWKGIDKHVLIVCDIHGEFSAKASSFKQNGCIKCKRENIPRKNKFSKEDFITRHKDKHKDINYVYDLTVYNGMDKNITVECPYHGLFSFLASNMSGCRKCMTKEYSEKVKLTEFNKAINEECKNTFIEKAMKIHEDKYDYKEAEYINSKTKVKINCKKHGLFVCSPNNHLKGKGCPKCKHNYSNKSLRWLKYRSIIDKCIIRDITNENGEYKIEGTKYKADGFCEDTNTIYEFYGTEYHGDPRYTSNKINNFLGKNYKELYNNTLKREQCIKDLGFKVISIWEADWDKIENKIIFIQKKFKTKYNKKLNLY